MNMRVGGLASGIDTDTIIKDLMRAERIPMDKMEQQKITMEWQRDKYREINTLRQQVDDMLIKMKLSSTYNMKNVNSSNESAVTATAAASALEGNYKIEVTQLATSAINVSDEISFEPDEDLHAIFRDRELTLSTFDEEGNENKKVYKLQEGDTLTDLVKRINDDDSPIRMFYDENTNKVVMETTRTGKYNINGYRNGKEMEFNADFQEIFNMSHTYEKGGTDAKFIYNDAYEVTTKENNYNLNGITFEFTNTNVDNPATITINNDIDAVVDNVKEFVDKYNELIEFMNETQQEPKYRDYPPLTEEQRKELEEREIEMWDEKAKSGILKGETIITSSLSNLRSNWYQSVETGGKFTVLTQIGITTTKDYFDGGKIEIDENKLREALTEDPASVQKLFAGNEDSKGIINHLEDSLDQLKDKINERAGRSTDTLTNYTLGKRISDIDNRMEAFENRLERIENRYWKQFTAMEKAISQMNSQSAMLMGFMNQ